MPPASPRSTAAWYLALDWRRHYRPQAPPWMRDLLRTDILLSAMFRNARAMAVTARSLSDAIGSPDWIEGSPYRGQWYFHLYRTPGEMLTSTMHFLVTDGRLSQGGTNHMLSFKNHAAKRKCRS